VGARQQRADTPYLGEVTLRLEPPAAPDQLTIKQRQRRAQTAKCNSTQTQQHPPHLPGSDH